MPAQITGVIVCASISLFVFVSFLGIGVWTSGGGMEDLQRRRANRRAPAGPSRQHFTGLDGAVELGHANGMANDTGTATAGDAAHDSTHAPADDTATGAASGEASGAASEPR